MAGTRKTSWLAEEIAEFLATCPTREQLLDYRPSPRAQQRAQELLARSEGNALTPDEQWELDQFAHAEMLIQLIKARLRGRKAVRP